MVFLSLVFVFVVAVKLNESVSNGIVESCIGCEQKPLMALLLYGTAEHSTQLNGTYALAMTLQRTYRNGQKTRRSNVTRALSGGGRNENENENEKQQYQWCIPTVRLPLILLSALTSCRTHPLFHRNGLAFDIESP